MKLVSFLYFTVLVMIEGSVCENCILPRTADLERILTHFIAKGGSANELDIVLTDFNVVCSAHGTQKDGLRIISVVVNYTCSGHTNSCISDSVIEQIESECINGQWSNSVLGNSVNIRSTITEASLTTESRENCSFCLSPELARSLSLTTDRVTHCAVTCRTLTNPLNGEVTMLGKTLDSIATYSCNDGYYLQGNTHRVCLDTSVWSGSTPNCEALPESCTVTLWIVIGLGVVSGLLGLVLLITCLVTHKIHREVKFLKSKHTTVTTVNNASYGVFKGRDKASSVDNGEYETVTIKQLK